MSPTSPPPPPGHDAPTPTAPTEFPFSAVVGADDAKLALVLAAVDPRLGGVLLRGDKGSAKTTLARGLAALLPGSAPFVELPVGATEDRLIGSLDVTAALRDGEVRFRPGLVAAAHGGVLYVDEVNLLPDHLVDALLDVATSGTNRIERDGVSHAHPARFVLVGSMNPEEGDLRPQLLDRFGLAVDVRAPASVGDRVLGVRRRLAYDTDAEALLDEWRDAEVATAAQIAGASSAAVDDQLLGAIAQLCLSAGVEGLRGDLVITRAAAALAGLEGRRSTTAADVRRVAPLALGHRQRRDPFDRSDLDAGDLDDLLDDLLDDALDDALDATPGDAPHGGAGADATEPPPSDGAPAGPPPAPEGAPDAPTSAPSRPTAPPAPDRSPAPVALLTATRAATDHTGRRSPGDGRRGQVVGARVPAGAPAGIAVAATAHAAATRRSDEPGSPAIELRDLREPVRRTRTGNLVILVVDTSGSMGAAVRVAAVRDALVGLLLDAYQRRDQVALVTFGGDGSHVALKPTASVEVARARLDLVATGGPTPLAEGLDTAAALARSAGAATGARRPLLVVVTDGRATHADGGADPLAAAQAAADRIRRARLDCVVVDAETGPTRLGLARALAEQLGARHLSLAELTGEAIEAAVRATMSG